MANIILYHIGFVLTTVFHHQVTNPRASTIFASPYITSLLRGMGMLGNLDQLTVVDGYNPITFHNLQKLGLPMPEHTPSPTSIEHLQ